MVVFGNRFDVAARAACRVVVVRAFTATPAVVAAPEDHIDFLDSALPDIAEHVAEEKRGDHGEQRRRIGTLARGHAEEAAEQFEGTRPPGIAQQQGRPRSHGGRRKRGHRARAPFPGRREVPQENNPPQVRPWQGRQDSQPAPRMPSAPPAVVVA